MDIASLNKPVADSVFRMIKDSGLKQNFVAERAGLSKQELNDMLNGRRIIKILDVVRLAKALNVKVSELFEEEREDAG